MFRRIIRKLADNRIAAIASMTAPATVALAVYDHKKKRTPLRPFSYYDLLKASFSDEKNRRHQGMNPQKLFDLGMQWFLINFDYALQQFKYMAYFHPENDNEKKCFAEAALLLLAKNQIKDAITLWRCIYKEAEMPFYLTLVVTMLIEQNKLLQAASYLEEIDQIEPLPPIWQEQLAHCYLQSTHIDHLKKSVAKFKDIVTEHPNVSHYLNELGVATFMQAIHDKNQFERLKTDAAHYFERALMANPTNKIAKKNLALTHELTMSLIYGDPQFYLKPVTGQSSDMFDAVYKEIAENRNKPSTFMLNIDIFVDREVIFPNVLALQRLDQLLKEFKLEEENEANPSPPVGLCSKLS